MEAVKIMEPLRRGSGAVGVRRLIMVALPLVLAVAVVLAPRTSFSATWQWITPERVRDMMVEGSGLWLIDVRGQVAFNSGHIEGSVNIQSEVLAIKRFPKRKVLVLADNGLGLRQAKEAASILLKKGQERVYLLRGGILAWEEGGHPVVGNRLRGSIRKVMVRELRWAIENGVSLRLLDLRGKEEAKEGTIPGSELVKGKSLEKRLKAAKRLMAESRKKGLAGKLQETVTAVLVLPPLMDVQGGLSGYFSGVPGDIRYLDGGYVSWAAKRDTKTLGECPVCPKAERKVER